MSAPVQPTSAPVHPPREASPPRSTGALLALLSVALYGSVVGFEFVNFDDGHYVFKNPHLGHGLDLDTLRWAFTTRYFGWWHPLTWVSHLLDVRLFGLWAGGHHLTSALLHAANTWLAWRVLLRLNLDPRRALLATLCFAWHPMRVESVAWVSERKDVLSVCFALLTILAWRGYRARPSPGRYGVVVLAFGAALASKAMVVTLPVGLAVLDLAMPGGRRPTLARVALDKVPLLAMSLGASLAVVFTQRAVGAVSSLGALGLGERLGGAPWAIARYVGKTLWPAQLCIMYPRLPLATWQVATGVLVVVATTGLAAWLAWRGRPQALVGWGLFVLTLLPVLGFLQAGAQLLADRYTYLGHLALFTGLALVLPEQWLRQRRTQALMLLVPLGWFVLSLVQLQTWHDSAALFAQALEVEPVNPPIQKRVDGLPLEAMLEQGRLQDALVEADALLARWPNDARVMILAGTASARAGHLEQAIERFTLALQLEPGNEDAERFLGFAREDLARTPR